MSWSDEFNPPNDDEAPFGVLPSRAPRGRPLVTARTSRYVSRVSIALMLLIAATDAVLGSSFVLIGLLMIGPYCALFTAQRARAAAVGVVAVLLALAPALPDGIWDTPAEFALTTAVLMVAIACTWAAGFVGSVTRR